MMAFIMYIYYQLSVLCVTDITRFIANIFSKLKKLIKRSIDMFFCLCL